MVRTICLGVSFWGGPAGDLDHKTVTLIIFGYRRWSEGAGAGHCLFRGRWSNVEDMGDKPRKEYWEGDLHLG